MKSVLIMQRLIRISHSSPRWLAVCGRTSTKCFSVQHALHTVQDKNHDVESTAGASKQKKRLPLALQYISEESVINKVSKSEETVAENDADNDIRHLQDSEEKLEDIKFEIDNLKALKAEYLTNVTQKDDSDYQVKAMMIGTPDKSHPPSTVPCGGCGAILHCNDPAIPGYIPQEKFKGLKVDQLAKLLCTRCTVMNTSNHVVQVDVDKNTYREVIRKIKKDRALVVMVIDVTDISNSIIPEFLNQVGKKRPIFIVGNKIDLISKDQKGYLNTILERLQQESERAMLNPSGKNISHICLVSAKTGYGIEQLINKLIKFWDVEGNVYLVGTTNSGKSTLFNKFLDSDYCKHSCRDIVQRATVSRWPGTTLNLIKFPIIKPYGWKMFLRMQRLKDDSTKDVEKMKKKKEMLKKYGGSKFAPLFATVGKTEFRSEEAIEEDARKYNLSGSQFSSYSFTGDDISATESISESSYRVARTTILEEKYVDSKWACDTPGLVNPNQIINILNVEELRKILKREMIRPRVFVMMPGYVMFITGLARIDYLEGGPNTFFTVHTNHLLPVHVVHASEADSFYLENIGTDKLGLPVGDSKRLDRMPSLCGQEFSFQTEEHQIASVDLQLSSLGWVSFAGKDKSIKIRAYTPGGRGMALRSPALLPNIYVFKGEKVGVGSKEYRMRKLKT